MKRKKGNDAFEDDPRLTAFALGELEGEERAEIEELVAANPQARALVDEVRALSTLVTQELAAEPAPRLSAMQRSRIEAAARNGHAPAPFAAPARPRFRLLRNPWARLASAAAAIVAVVGVLEVTGTLDRWIDSTSGTDVAYFHYSPFGDPALGYGGEVEERITEELESLGYLADGESIQVQAGERKLLNGVVDANEGDQALLRSLGYVRGGAGGGGGTKVPPVSIQGSPHRVTGELTYNTGNQPEIGGAGAAGGGRGGTASWADPNSDASGYYSQPGTEADWLRLDAEIDRLASEVLATGDYSNIKALLRGGYTFDPDGDGFGYSMSFFDSATGPLLLYAGVGNTRDPNFQVYSTGGLGIADDPDIELVPSGGFNPGVLRGGSGGGGGGDHLREIELEGELLADSSAEAALHDVLKDIGYADSGVADEPDLGQDNHGTGTDAKPPSRGWYFEHAGGRYDRVTRPYPRRGVPGTEGYDPIPENPFVPVKRDPRSTFSIDVDTASYANVRRFLRKGQLPPRTSVRIEEMINYFRYDYEGPGSEHPFGTHVEVASCPWQPRHRLVRIGIKGREAEARETKARNLVFLLDVSGSMDEPDKLPLVKKALHLLVDQLGEDDRIAIVTYAGSSSLCLPSTRGHRRVEILDAIDRLSAGGSTNGGAGIELAYQQAAAGFVEGGVNRVILASDGDFNVGVTSRDGLIRQIEEKARGGVFLSILGFGEGNLKDSQMEQIADKGNGNYSYIDSLSEARKVLVHEMAGTLETIAKDVKIQIEFNPRNVQAFRLIGYENRKLAHRDFNDDRKDAGEIGAGHTVTALYEVIPAGVEIAGRDDLKYQPPVAEPTEEAAEDAYRDELLTVLLRYKQPAGSTSQLLEVPVKDAETSFEQASDDFRFAAAVASFGMLLRGSRFAGNASLELAYALARSGAENDRYGYRQEFLRVIDAAIGAATSHRYQNR